MEDAIQGTIEIQGLDELEAQLKWLPLHVRRKVARDALKAGAQVIKTQAEINAPFKTGALMQSIEVQRGRSRRRGTVNFVVGVSKGWFKGDQFYAAFHEFGTSHQPARPFLRPAFDTTRDRALSLIIDVLKRGIDKKMPARGRFLEPEP